ncbi:MAG TPA: acetyl-CoA acetyltransferase [Acidimicrobiales bacterium]|nr:acetyl-CoA acetyltransferase [Acidimicrobiales bacterium]
MALDPRTPVIVGVGQSVRRPTVDELEGVAEPAEMMAEVLRLAGDARLLAAADSVRVVESVSWHYSNPALAVAERVGASPRDTVRTTTGGNSPQMLVNDTAAAIARGELDVAVVVGAEAVYTRYLARKAKVWLPWSVQDSAVTAPRVLGVDLPGNNDMELDRGFVLPTQGYPMLENALRAEAGESIDSHQQRIAALWAGFSEVAAGNPYAWSPTARTADEIATVTPDNRMVGFPYPKLMNANIQTDQAAGLILCSVEAARRYGVPEDRWVFPWFGGDGHDTWHLSERESLTASPPLRRFEVPAGDIAHVDIYSCFPSAVQIAARELGFELDRQLTVTGGLTFAGGPANNYVTHSIATMVDVLRADPGSLGLVTAVGWYLTKHAVGIYSTTPPPDGFRHMVLGDDMPSREAAASYEGDVEIETYTVMFDREGSPETGLYALRLPDGRRAWGRSGPVDVGEELCGRRVRLAADGTVSL